ncbi:hypothetical protein LTR66_006396, partial [Elasticomyces elasticus]
IGFTGMDHHKELALRRPQLGYKAHLLVRPFRFLDLSAELRNLIYELVLVSDQPITANFGWAKQDHGSSAAAKYSLMPPPLTAVNKQIRDEALPIHYGMNVFEFRDPRGMPLLDSVGKTLEVIGPEGCSMLRDVTISYVYTCFMDRIHKCLDLTVFECDFFRNGLQTLPKGIVNHKIIGTRSWSEFYDFDPAGVELTEVILECSMTWSGIGKVGNVPLPKKVRSLCDTTYFYVSSKMDAMIEFEHGPFEGVASWVTFPDQRILRF